MTNRQRALLRICRLFDLMGGLEELHRLTDLHAEERERISEDPASFPRGWDTSSSLSDVEAMKLGGLTMMTVAITDLIDDLFPDCIEARRHEGRWPREEAAHATG